MNYQEVIRHPDHDIVEFKRVPDQYSYREKAIDRALAENGFNGCYGDFSALAARGGLLRPLEGGTYRIDWEMYDDLAACKYGEHASNLGAMIAYNKGRDYNIPAFTVEPVSVDELQDQARYSGLPELPRHSRSHALNMRSVAREVAAGMGRPFEDVNLIVVHLGSGISVACFSGGKMIDVSNPNNEGPFSLERSGSLPVLDLAGLCFSGIYSREEITAKITRTGGIYAYLGTKDFKVVEAMVDDGDLQARRIVQAMCYQVAKEVGAMSAVIRGMVDGIILTGGIAHSGLVVDEIAARVSFLGKSRPDS